MAKKDNLAPLVTQLEARINKFQKQMDKAAGTVDKTTGRMNKRWNRHTKAVEARFKKFGANLGKAIGAISAGSVVGFIAFTKASLSAADELQHFSQQVGVSAEKIQEYEFIANRLGISQKNLRNAFIFSTKNLGQYINEGVGPAAKAIEQLGLAQDIAAGRISDSGDLMDALINKLSDIDNDAKRASLAGKIFGERYGPQMNELLKQGTAGLEAFKKEARDLGVILGNEAVEKASAANDALGKLGETIKVGLRGEVIRLAPEIEAITNDLIALVPAMVDWAGGAISGLEDVLDLMDRMSRIFNAQPDGEGLAQRFPLDEKGLEARAKKIESTLDFVFNLQNETTKKINRNKNSGDFVNLVDIFGIPGLDEIEKQGRDLKEALYQERLRVEIALRDLESTVPTAGKKKTITPIEIGAGGGGTKTAKGPKLSDREEFDLKRLKTLQAERKAQFAQRVADAKALADNMKGPIDEYAARLAEIKIIEDDAFASQFVSAEAFSRARTDALTELGEATGDYEATLSRLVDAQTSGQITAADFGAAYQTLTNELETAGVALDRLGTLSKNTGLDPQAVTAAADAVKASSDYTADLNEEKLKTLEIQAQEIEAEIILAELRGDTVGLDKAERRLEVVRETMELIRAGADINTAGATAESIVGGRDLAEFEGKIRSIFKGGLRAAVDGNFGSFLKDKLLNAADGMFDQAVDGLFDLLSQQLPGLLSGIFGGVGGGGGLGQSGGILAELFAGFFADGGKIPRGKFGIAGEGGKPEIVTGPATVYSNKDSKQMLKQTAGQGGGASYVFAPVIDARGADVQAVDRMGQQLNKLRLDFEKEKSGFPSRAQRFNDDRARNVRYL